MTEEEAKVETMYLKELDVVQARTVILMRALRLFYSALGGFASSAVVSLLGALMVVYIQGPFVSVVESIAVLVGLAGVWSLITGCYLLARESRLAVAVLQEQSVHVHERVAARIKEAKTSEKMRK